MWLWHLMQDVINFQLHGGHNMLKLAASILLVSTFVAELKNSCDYFHYPLV